MVVLLNIYYENKTLKQDFSFPLRCRYCTKNPMKLLKAINKPRARNSVK